MACARCEADVETKRGAWCANCERDYDTWVRRHAADIVWAVLGGGVVLAGVGMVLPLLGVDWIVAASAAFCGWGSVYAIYRIGKRRRRKQFLAGAPLPRAYLPAPK
jgi:hypothetical protein